MSFFRSHFKVKELTLSKTAGLNNLGEEVCAAPEEVSKILEAAAGSGLSIDAEGVVDDIGCVLPVEDDAIPPPDPLTPPPLAPMSPTLSNPTVFPASANTVLDTAEDVAAATGDVLCGILGKTPVDGWATADVVVCPSVCNWLAGIATDVSVEVADVLVPVGQVEPVVDWDIGAAVLDVGSVVVV